MLNHMRSAGSFMLILYMYFTTLPFIRLKSMALDKFLHWIPHGGMLDVGEFSCSICMFRVFAYLKTTFNIRIPCYAFSTLYRFVVGRVSLSLYLDELNLIFLEIYCPSQSQCASLTFSNTVDASATSVSVIRLFIEKVHDHTETSKIFLIRMDLWSYFTPSNGLDHNEHEVHHTFCPQILRPIVACNLSMVTPYPVMLAWRGTALP